MSAPAQSNGIYPVHRLSTILYTTQNELLNKDGIAERGIQQELVNFKKVYFTLVKMN
jgi:ABC-type bacteriocin/lantibiotic exporter with double-glycine peptidase domain